jgi:hypothetical protein
MPASASPSLLGGLFVLEALPLLDGVVQLGVAVAQLAGVDEELEPLGEVRVVRSTRASGEISVG